VLEVLVFIVETEDHLLMSKFSFVII